MDCLDVLWVVISPRAPHPLGLDVCDLKHNFAVWQRYALNDLDVPIDCGFNPCREHPQNLAFLSSNRKVAVPRVTGLRTRLYSRQRYALTRETVPPLPSRRMNHLGARRRQHYAFNAAKICFK